MFETTVRAFPKFFRRRPLAVLLLAASALLPGVRAAELPHGERPVSITSREQPLEAFLQDLFSQLDVPVVISPQVQGVINGQFDQPADRLIREVARAYNLLVYYDGAVAHVIPARESATRTFSTAGRASARVMRAAAELHLTDPRNTLRASGSGTLLAQGAPRFIEMVQDLVRSADPGSVTGPAMATPDTDFKVFYLRYAWAQDVYLSLGGREIQVPGVASILRSLVSAQGRAGAPGTQVHTTPDTVPGMRGLPQGSGDLGTLGWGPNMPTGDVMTTALSGAPARGGEAAAASRMVMANAAWPARIEADPRLNAVIVRDTPERLARYAALIQSLDVEPQSLEIEATIVDIYTDRLQELGVNWRWSNAGNEVLFGNGTASDLRLRNNVDVTPSGRGGFVSLVLGSRDQFVARISALQTNGAAKVVSSPQVVTLSNVEALFDNSSTFYVRVAGRDDVDLFNITAGTSLRVTPHVFNDNGITRIKLLVQVEDGKLTNNQVDDIPVVERSTINTQALIAEGESLLIGGMVRDSAQYGEDKIPLLGDVPILGNLFKTRSNSGERVERMFLISPRLASSRATAAAAARINQPMPDNEVRVPWAPKPEPLPPGALPPPPPGAPQAPAPSIGSAPAGDVSRHAQNRGAGSTWTTATMAPAAPVRTTRADADATPPGMSPASAAAQRPVIHAPSWETLP